MGFVKTPQELESYYARKVRQFPNAWMMGVMFMADAEVTRRLLPPPLEQAPLPGGLIFIAEYGETNLGPGYREAALFLRCTYQGNPGTYCLSMPIDSDASRLHNGRDIYGFPKKAAHIHFERTPGRAVGWVERGGTRFVSLDIALTDTMPELPPQVPTYLFKAMPRADLEPGFDGPVFLVSQQTDIEPRKIEIGTAKLTLAKSELEPWAELGDVQVLMAFSFESANRMQPGKVLAEVDGAAFLPYYFKMTDLFTAVEA